METNRIHVVVIFFIFVSAKAAVFQNNTAEFRENLVEITPRQRPPNPFLQWLSNLLGGFTTTTTQRPPTVAPKNCTKCVCGITNKRNRIVGGQETQVNEYPWVAMMIYSGNRFYCGGTLINDRYILTAAHCVSGFSHDRISVRLLDHDRTSTNPRKIDRKIARVTQHPLYSSSTYNNDMALLLLDKPVEMSSELRPVCLPTTQGAFVGRNGIVTGWGATKENGPTSNTLQEVTVPILSNDECKRSNYGTTRITENMMCAGYPDGQKDSCQGDSGGPMHIVEGSHYEIAGIVSWGEGCAQPKYPGVYTRVNRFSTWLKTYTADACYC